MKITTKKLKSGNFGVFLGDVLISIAKREEKAGSIRVDVDRALADAYADGRAEGYDEGHADGYDEGYSEGEFAGGD
jgi:flagellar biosynthesis/type III secretory pathway protein FliH